MLEYLHQSKEEYIIVNLVGKIAELAEKYPLFGPWVMNAFGYIVTLEWLV